MTYAPKPENHEEATAAARRSTLRASLWVIALIVILLMCVGIVLLSGETPAPVEEKSMEQTPADMPLTTMMTVPVPRLPHEDSIQFVEERSVSI